MPNARRRTRRRHWGRGRPCAHSSGCCPACLPIATRVTCPRASAWPWPWPSWSPRPLPFCCSTSRREAWTTRARIVSCVCCATSQATVTPLSWPHTTWSLPRAWRTGLWSWRTGRSSRTARHARWSATRRSSPPRWPRYWPPRSGSRWMKSARTWRRGTGVSVTVPQGAARARVRLTPAIRFGSRSSFLLLLTTLFGLAAFGWPLLIHQSGGQNTAHSGDAPWIFVGLCLSSWPLSWLSSQKERSMPRRWRCSGSWRRASPHCVWRVPASTASSPNGSSSYWRRASSGAGSGSSSAPSRSSRQH